MVKALFKTIASLEIRPGYTLDVVLVENGSEGLLAPVADEFQEYAPGIPITYLMEPEVGIASARNKALNHALAEGYDKLAFVDDDEIARPDWISNLLQTQMQRGLDLTGGPVVPFTNTPPAGFFPKVILRNLLQRSHRIQRVSARLAERGHDGSIMLATNNWMIDLDFCRRHGPQFDTGYNLTGGEDSAFFYECKRVGAVTGWCPDAFIDEEVPVNRLSVGYQFRRSRDQSVVSFRRKYTNRPVAKWIIVPIGSLFKLITGALLLMLAPITFGRTLLSSIRALGQGLGRLIGLMGFRTFHYKKTTGY
jgi:glycosyltransferase involved in cell wall biosynthesis